jgi:hypothetical protein
LRRPDGGPVVSHETIGRGLVPLFLYFSCYAAAARLFPKYQLPAQVPDTQGIIARPATWFGAFRKVACIFLIKQENGGPADRL